MTICIETLKIKSMVENQNHSLAREVSDVSLYEFTRRLEYKANWYGKQLVKVDAFYPSSQLCHVCGYKNPDIKNLSIREWSCPSCSTHHDRDTNAAINILSEGLKLAI